MLPYHPFWMDVVKFWFVCYSKWDIGHDPILYRSYTVSLLFDIYQRGFEMSAIRLRKHDLTCFFAVNVHFPGYEIENISSSICNIDLSREYLHAKQLTLYLIKMTVDQVG